MNSMYKITDYQNVIEKIINNGHDIDLLQNALKQMLLGWISTPLELDPEQRLDIAIYYEAIQSHFKLLQQIKSDFQI